MNSGQKFSFLIKGKSYSCLRKSFISNCRAAESIKADEYQIPIDISQEALQIFIRALGSLETEIDPQYVADLYCLSQLFDFHDLLRKLYDFYSRCDDKSIIIDQIILSCNNGFDTTELESLIATSIDNIIKCQTFFALPPEILTRIIFKSRLSSNNVVEIIHKLRNMDINMIDYFALYSLIDYKDLTKENREIMKNELQNPEISVLLINYINQAHDVDLQEQRQSFESVISSITSQLNEIKNSVHAINNNISTTQKKIMEIDTRSIIQIKDLIETQSNYIQSNDQNMITLQFDINNYKSSMSKQISDLKRTYDNNFQLSDTKLSDLRQLFDKYSKKNDECVSSISKSISTDKSIISMQISELMAALKEESGRINNIREHSLRTENYLIENFQHQNDRYRHVPAKIQIYRGIRL